MAFRIRDGEPVGKAIERLARSQIGHAVQALKDDQQPLSQRVHTLRTSVKKVRALTELARPVVGKRATRASRRLRKAAASTSALRDGEVLLKTFDGLLPSLASVGESASLQRTRGRLVAKLRKAGVSFAADRRIGKLKATLRRARRRTKRWVPPKNGWRGPRQGLFEGYRNARRAMKRAFELKTGDAFHRWRQAVKAHRYQLQLLEELWPGESTAHVESLERLGELLGEEHDLTVLEETVLVERACFPDKEDCARLLALIDRRRHTLRGEARALGQPLFAEKPKAFGRRLRDELRAGPRRGVKAVTELRVA